MAAFAGSHVPWPRSLITRLKAATTRTALDERLAHGADPGSTPELACRARVLRGWRMRHALADGLERLVADAEGTPPRLGSAVPVDRHEVLAARRDLLRLADAWRAEPAAHARAIAEASLLLTDGTGPVFTPHVPGTLREAAFRAAYHAEAG